jgi:hypothetical protein
VSSCEALDRKNTYISHRRIKMAQFTSPFFLIPEEDLTKQGPLTQELVEFLKHNPGFVTLGVPVSTSASSQPEVSRNLVRFYRIAAQLNSSPQGSPEQSDGHYIVADLQVVESEISPTIFGFPIAHLHRCTESGETPHAALEAFDRHHKLLDDNKKPNEHTSIIILF